MLLYSIDTGSQTNNSDDVRDDVRDHDMGCSSIDATVKPMNNNNGAQETDSVVDCAINATRSDVVEPTTDVSCVQKERIDMPPQTDGFRLQAHEPFSFPRGIQDGIG